LLHCAHELLDFVDYQDLFAKYDTVEKISFDYAVVEKEPEIQVMRFNGMWKDLGTWNTLTEAMEEKFIGQVHLNEDCENTHVVNEMDVPIICMGLKNIVVAASPEGVLVADKKQSSYIKPLVDRINQQIMFAEKSWGRFRVLDVEDDSLTIKITLQAGHRMNYHSHERRDEVWNVVSGQGMVIVNDEKRQVRSGDVVKLPQGCRHMLVAKTELQVIEVQMGQDIDVHDKRKYQLCFDESLTIKC
jgi:mannose-1-phosphate guanylyltransferase